MNGVYRFSSLIIFFETDFIAQVKPVAICLGQEQVPCEVYLPVFALPDLSHQPEVPQAEGGLGLHGEVGVVPLFVVFEFFRKFDGGNAGSADVALCIKIFEDRLAVIEEEMTFLHVFELGVNRKLSHHISLKLEGRVNNFTAIDGVHLLIHTEVVSVEVETFVQAVLVGGDGTVVRVDAVLLGEETCIEGLVPDHRPIVFV